MNTGTHLLAQLRAGAINRRSFIAGCAAAGIAMPVALHAVNASAQATPAAQGQPAVGTEGKTRGSAGELRLIQWQAPTLLATHSAQGGKDNLAACLIMEPLINYLDDGTMLPNLITEIPSVENGLLADARDQLMATWERAGFGDINAMHPRTWGHTRYS